MRPPVGKVGQILYIPDFCAFCSRHFLISEELHEHKKLHHFKEAIEDALYEINSEIPDLEDK